jgi:hypothetical protein
LIFHFDYFILAASLLAFRALKLRWIIIIADMYSMSFKNLLFNTCFATLLYTYSDLLFEFCISLSSCKVPTSFFSPSTASPNTLFCSTRSSSMTGNEVESLEFNFLICIFILALSNSLLLVMIMSCFWHSN